MSVNLKQVQAGIERRLAIRALAVLVLVAVAVQTAWAGSEQRKGTGGAHELRLPVGARGSALGGSIVGDASGVEAIYWNPAGMAALEGTEALFSNTQYFAEMKLNYVGVAAKLGEWAVIGLNAKVLSIGDIIVTTEEAPDGTGEIIEPTFTVLGLSMARQFTDRVRAGATVNFVNERILSSGASGVAFDFGVQYLTGWRGLKLGVAMKNFGTTMTYEGENFEASFRPPDSDPQSANRTFRSTSSSFEMPSFFTLAASYDALATSSQRLAIMGGFQNNNFLGDNVHTGLEWSWRNTFALRGSWFGSIINNTDPITGEDSGEFESGDDLYSGYAFGAGANVRAGDARLAVDLAWRPIREFFDDTLEIGLKLGF
jgi:hypothetical protein